jgi:transposase-like protein
MAEKNHITRKLTVREFFKRFPDEDACLEHVLDVRFGLRHTCQACGVVNATFHRLEKRKAYCCAHCGDHLYPCAGTIFEKSRTPLQMWFYAIFLFISTRHGVSGMELHRALGVTRKTGYRMGMQIRQLMEKADVKGLIGGSGKHIELDEAFWGGRISGQGRGSHMTQKAIVMGLKERGGPIRAKVVPDTKLETLRATFHDNVAPHSIVSTDEHGGYNLLVRDGFIHGTVQHSAKEYVRMDEVGNKVHVNSLESFWRLFKASVRGTHVQISKGHAQKYLNEFCFRQNYRELQNAMFDVLVSAV